MAHLAGVEPEFDDQAEQQRRSKNQGQKQSGVEKGRGVRHGSEV